MATGFVARKKNLWHFVRRVVESVARDGVSSLAKTSVPNSRSVSAVDLLRYSSWRGAASSISAGRFGGRAVANNSFGLFSEGLPSLLPNGVDAMMVRPFHSFACGATVRHLKLVRGSDRTLAGGRKLHSVVGNKFTPSSLMKTSVELYVRPALMSWTPRRSLSSESWLQRTTEKLKKTLSMKPRAGSVQGRSMEILSEVSKPVQTTFARYREAIGLQMEAFWKRNYLLVVGAMGLGVCLVLWRIMYGVTSTFISMSEGMAKFGFLALSAAMVILTGVFVRARFTINPDSVYRIAMRKLNTSAAVLEVMGAPLSGTDLRAYIMSGGGLRVKNFRPRLAGKRCFIIFPIHGSERRGLVSIEVKKKKGQYDFKLLAVDVPTAGADQRLFLIGDEKEYEVGGGLISELRDPIVKAMAAQKEFEDIDMREEEEEKEDDERKAAEAQNELMKEELEKLALEEGRDEKDKLQEQKPKNNKD